MQNSFKLLQNAFKSSSKVSYFPKEFFENYSTMASCVAFEKKFHLVLQLKSQITRRQN